MMTLIVDVMGFENDIKEAVDACRDFHIRHSDVNFLLIGNEKEISSCLKSSDNFFIKIFHTSEYVKMNDDPLKIIRNKNTSMYVALSKLVNNEGDGVLSAGNTGCFVALSYLLVKPINNISKPGFMPCIPTIKNNKNIYLIDVGANKECNGNDLYNFALMANLYCKNVCKIDSPKIGILNIGAEETKGFDFHKDGNELLKQNKKINYVGFVEPREIMRGNIDILVCDGYSGNLVLKTLEGSLKSVALVLKNSYKKIFNWLGFIFSLGVIKKIVKTFDYKRNAGALVIGLNKTVVKTHGSADKKQFYSSLEMLYNCVKNDIINKIKESINNNG